MGRPISYPRYKRNHLFPQNETRNHPTQENPPQQTQALPWLPSSRTPKPCCRNSNSKPPSRSIKQACPSTRTMTSLLKILTTSLRQTSNKPDKFNTTASSCSTL